MYKYTYQSSPSCSNAHKDTNRSTHTLTYSSIQTQMQKHKYAESTQADRQTNRKTHGCRCAPFCSTHACLPPLPHLVTPPSLPLLLPNPLIVGRDLQVVDIVRSNVKAVLQRIWHSSDVDNLRLCRIFSRVFNRLLWSHGQGLWNCFSPATG